LEVTWCVTSHNQDLHIEEAMLEHIFEYGVPSTEADEHHGQGVLLPRIYSCKMGSTVVALNAAYGVAIGLRLASVNQGRRRST